MYEDRTEALVASPLTAQRNVVAALGGEFILSPVELFTVLDGGTRNPYIAADTGADKGRLRKPAVLLSEVCALQLRVAGGRRKLLELEPVDTVGGDEGEEDEGSKSGEQHGGSRTSAGAAQLGVVTVS